MREGLRRPVGLEGGRKGRPYDRCARDCAHRG